PLAALVEGVLQSMFLNKVKMVVIVLLALGAVGSGAGFVAHRTIAGQPSAKPDRASVLPGGAVAKANDKATEAKPNEAAPVPQPKANQVKPEPIIRLDSAARIRRWREQLNQPINFEGIDDPKVTLSEALDSLQRRYGITFEINHKAFTLADVHDVSRFEITAQM